MFFAAVGVHVRLLAPGGLARPLTSTNDTSDLKDGDGDEVCPLGRHNGEYLAWRGDVSE